jgi:hypothetical protein
MGHAGSHRSADNAASSDAGVGYEIALVLRAEKVREIALLPAALVGWAAADPSAPL